MKRYASEREHSLARLLPCSSEGPVDRVPIEGHERAAERSACIMRRSPGLYPIGRAGLRQRQGISGASFDMERLPSYSCGSSEAQPGLGLRLRPPIRLDLEVRRGLEDGIAISELPFAHLHRTDLGGMRRAGSRLDPWRQLGVAIRIFLQRERRPE